MKTVDCVVRAGSVFFRCAHCAGEQAIHLDRPFIPQVREVSESHRCAVDVAATMGLLRLVPTAGGPDATTRS
jgi:hypothetical protein